MAQDILQEVTRYSITVTRNEDPFISLHNSFITLKLYKGLHIFELAHNLRSLDKELSCLKSIVESSKTSPAASLFTSNVINSRLSNMEVQEMFVDSTLWPHNPQLMQEETCVQSYEWSPPGLVNHQSVLAILNNVGGIDLYVLKGNKWQCMLEMAKTFDLKFSTDFGTPSKFEHLKNAAHTLASTAICWSPHLNDNKSCFFVTGQKNGFLMFWLIKCKNMELDVTFLECLKSVYYEIVSLIWIPRDNKKFCIICSDTVGQITLLNCQFQDYNIKLISSQILWSYKDKMLTNMQYTITDKYTLLYCTKNRHLLVFLIDENLNILDQYVNNINDYKIISICKGNECMCITTLNGKIYQIEAFVKENKISVNYKEIVYKNIVSSNHEVHSIGYSQNKILCVLSLINRKLVWRKEPSKIDIVIMSNSSYTVESLLEMLLENQSKKLTYYLDVIEFLRFKCVKYKQLPILDYEELYNKCSKDLYLLKVFLIVAIIYKQLENAMKLPGGFLPLNNTPEQIRLEILKLHGDSLIKKLHKKFKEEGLTVFESETFVGVKRFLEYYHKSNETDITKEYSTDVLNIVDSNDFHYTCQCCDSKLKKFVCRNNHLNMYCMLSLTPIESDIYIACRWCNSTARLELYEDEPLCLFCDVGLDLVK